MSERFHVFRSIQQFKTLLWLFEALNQISLNISNKIYQKYNLQPRQVQNRLGAHITTMLQQLCIIYPPRMHNRNNVLQKKKISAFTKQDKICAQRSEHSRLLDFSGNFTGTAQNERHCLRMTCISSFDYDLYRAGPNARTNGTIPIAGTLCS